MKKRAKFLYIILLVSFVIFVQIILEGLKTPNWLVSFWVNFWFLIIYAIVLYALAGLASNRKRYLKHISIYTWMGELYDGDENLLTQLRTYKVKFKTLDNLQVIKSMILKSTKADLKVLKIYKAYYKGAMTETTNELYFKAFLGIIAGYAAFMFRDFAIKSESVSEFFVTVIIIAITILAIIDSFNQSKKRINLLIEILDICIEEIEDEKEKVDKENKI